MKFTPTLKKLFITAIIMATTSSYAAESAAAGAGDSTDERQRNPKRGRTESAGAGADDSQQIECFMCTKPYSQEHTIELVKATNDTVSVKLPCNHIGHYPCVKTWLKKNSSCPECRGAVKVIEGGYVRPRVLIEADATAALHVAARDGKRY